LVDSEVIALEVELEILGAMGLTFSRDDYLARFMGLSTDAYHALVDTEARTRLGRPLGDEVRGSMRLRENMVARLTEVPGAARTVGAVTLPKAIASSGSMEGLSRKLTRTGLWDLFAPHIYSADHVRQAKPAPDLFLHAAAALGVAPEVCLVIEDSIHGVTAARAAGMRVWGFLGGGHADDALGDRLTSAGADRIVRDWPEASALLAELNR
jgi:beta-phosphoglucomutase-like phosphatase (HAD superfamily)